MRRFISFAALTGLALFAAGCTQEQQLEEAQEELTEERVETAEAAEEATQDGTVTPAERSEIREEQGEIGAARGLQPGRDARGSEAAGEGHAHGYIAARGRPNVSSRPAMRLRFWIA